MKRKYGQWRGRITDNVDHFSILAVAFGEATELVSGKGILRHLCNDFFALGAHNLVFGLRDGFPREYANIFVGRQGPVPIW